jgi:hypothetical protein
LSCSYSRATIQHSNNRHRPALRILGWVESDIEDAALTPVSRDLVTPVESRYQNAGDQAENAGHYSRQKGRLGHSHRSTQLTGFGEGTLATASRTT